MEEQFNQPFENASQQQVQTEQVQMGQSAVQLKYAGFWIRVVANMADGIVVSVAMAILVILASLMSGVKGLIVAYIIAIFLSISYFVYMTTKYQATLGKKLVGIMVLTGEGEKASVGKIILREVVGKIISSMIFSIGYMMAGFTERKRALHDMIADTVVVYKNPSQKVKSSMVLGIIVGWLVVSGLLGYVFSIVEKNVLPTQTQSQAGSGSFSVSYTSPGATSPVALSPQPAGVQSQNVASNGNETNNQILASMLGTVARLENNFSQNKTYSGFALSSDNAMSVSTSTCTTITHLDIAPNGKTYVLWRPSCADPSVAFCAENGATSIMQNANTQTVAKTYHCVPSSVTSTGSAVAPAPAANNLAAGSGSFSVSSTPAPASSQTQTGSATSVYPKAVSNKNPITYDACVAQGGEEQSSFIDCSGVSLGIDSSSSVNGQSVFCCK